MQFNLHKRQVPRLVPVYGQTSLLRQDGTKDAWTWTLDRADGSTICQGPGDFDSEADARSQIAQAKKSMKGAMRTKVVSP